MRLTSLAVSPRALLWLFFLANYVAMVALCTGFVPEGGLDGPSRWFLGAVALSYPALYLTPALLLSLGLASVAGRRREWQLQVALTLAVVAFALSQLFFYADLRVYRIFGFHLNGFVWNLLTTPGGFESMGGGPEAETAAGVIAFGVLGVEAALLVALARERPLRAARRLCSGALVSVLAGGLLLLSLGERVVYGVADLSDYAPVLQQASAFPLYQPMSFGSLADRLGFAVKRTEAVPLGVVGTRLAYPLHPVALVPGARRPNFLVLCAESLRADMLDPEVMPASWALAERSSRFTQHLSSGNGTRMGVFGLFYGLPGSYWFEFLERHQDPVLLNTLASSGYRIEAFTSDKFSYPEFDQTVFAAVSGRHLHAAVAKDLAKKPSWQRDREQVSKLLGFLDGRDRSEPFFAYFFFESPHARYEFPPEAVIRTPYLEDFDYVTADLQRDMPLIENRYVNSVHHLDSQIARILDHLEATGLADETVVIVTGDHGEEFMEKGRWGHNSSFSEEQIRVPFVLHVPGRAPERIDRLTSHLDVPATLLELAGARGPASDYSFGQSLLGEAQRVYGLVSDWSRVVYVDESRKVSFPMHLSAFFRQEVTDRQDAPVADRDASLHARLPAFREIMGDLERFTRESPAGAAQVTKVPAAGR